MPSNDFQLERAFTRTFVKAALMAGAATLALSGTASAQTPAPQSPTPQARPTTPAQTPAQTPPTTATEADAAEETEVETVVVTGQRDGTRTSIDAISYSLANDLQATTGSLADALRNVPAVSVDVEGNVALRGDSSVTILVDGQPSGIFTGPGRGQAVLQLPADRYARIEVMTNPSAAYSPGGSGGVINLITKPVAPTAPGAPGALAQTQTTGSLRANVGDNGRWNAGVSGSWQRDRLTLSGDISHRRDPVEVDVSIMRDLLNPATGAVVGTTRNDIAITNDQDGTIGRLTAEYRLTPRTQITGELRGVAFSGEGTVDGDLVTRDASGAVVNAYRRTGTTDFEFANWGATGRILHRFDDAGHEWSNELRYDRNDNESDAVNTTVFQQPALPTFVERFQPETRQETLGFTSAYVRPFANGGRLRAGYQLEDQRPEQVFSLSRGPSEAALTPIPQFSNRFEARQTVHALYATYERPFGDKLSAQAGLRLEQADIRIDDLTGGLTATQDYFRAYPTAHLQYQLTETDTLRGSYSRRIQRPQPAQLNPFVAYSDPLNLRSGNPDLEPQTTDAFELQWQRRQGQTFYQATAYLRDTDGAFTDVAIDLGNNVLLTRPENLGGRRDVGVDLNANGQLHSTLRYGAGLNVFRQDVDAGGVPGGRDRSDTLVSGRLNLNWQPTRRDFFQVSGFWQSDQLLPQGTREAGGMVNMGYRRTLTPTLSLNVTGRDVFNSFNNATVFDTPLFRERQETSVKLRAFHIGLTWAFGGPRRQPEQFDFSSGPGGG